MRNRDISIIVWGLMAAACGTAVEPLALPPTQSPPEKPASPTDFDPGPEALLSASAPDGAPAVLEARKPVYDVTVDVPPPKDCGACAGCGEYAADCEEICDAMQNALEPDAATSWWSCVSQDLCQPERTWTCFDQMNCDDAAVVGAHCDALARCSSDGRGWLDEAACRADPYHEPQQWACLVPSRREAITSCLSGMQCSDLELCLNNAACAGEPGCMRVMSTRLVVDCHRICFDDVNSCGWGNERFARCMGQCDEAAFRLADAPRREVEACALQTDACEYGGSTPISDCAANLQCQMDAMATAEARCGAQPELTAQAHRWACLGEVIQAAIEQCVTDSACGELAGCVQRATCGDSGDCLDFLDELEAP